MVTRIRGNKGHFGFRYFICEHTADAFALGMYLEHDARRSRSVHTEELLQDIDDELHGRVIVVEENHLVKRRTLGLRPCLLDDQTMPLLCMFLGHPVAMWSSVLYRARTAR